MGWMAAATAKVPHVVWTVHCSNMDLKPYGKMIRAVRRLLIKLSPKIEAVVVNSEAGQVAHTDLGYAPLRWVRIDNGFDIPELNTAFTLRREARAELGLKDKDIVILMAADVEPMKGYSVFLNAARTLSLANANARFVMAGVGTDTSEVGALVIEHELEDVAFGLGQRSDMLRLYAMADIVSLTSVFGEGLPNSIGEAMAAAKAVVATDVGDTARLIGEAGFVVPPGQHNAVAQAWNDIIMTGPKGIKARGEEAQAQVKSNFARVFMTHRFEALYDEILSNQETSKPP